VFGEMGTDWRLLPTDRKLAMFGLLDLNDASPLCNWGW
jgi:hypothetical protein